MNLYLARHGQSILNAQKVHQFADTPLSELGRQQAQFLAKRVEDLPLDVILASSYTRATQTAEIVAQHRASQIPLEVSPLLREVTRPTEVMGKSVNDPEVLRIRELIRQNYHTTDWRYSDEENFSLAKERALQCRAMLESRPEENVLAVSHGQFLTLLICTMLFGEEMNSREFKSFLEHVYVKNTGLTWCTFSQGEWKLVTWNDHAHLAE